MFFFNFDLKLFKNYKCEVRKLKLKIKKDKHEGTLMAI